MRINANEIRPGNVLEHQNGLWQVHKVNHVKPGKGGAFAQVEMKNIQTGTKLNERFRSEDKVERARLEQRPMQYLYDDGEALTFMDNQNYEQLSLPYDVIGDGKVWLQESMNVSIEMHEGNPIGVELPAQVEVEVIEADAVVKGQTASSSYKPSKVENGETVMVPPFVEAGIKIIVSTADGSYVGRASS